MTAVIGGRSLQEEETRRGNISVIMLMECIDENVPIEKEQTASKNVRAGQSTTGMVAFFLSTLNQLTTLSRPSSSS